MLYRNPFQHNVIVPYLPLDEKHFIEYAENRYCCQELAKQINFPLVATNDQGDIQIFS